MKNVLITGSGGYLGSMLYNKMSNKFKLFWPCGFNLTTWLKGMPIVSQLQCHIL